jgi:hypothetical protein
VLFVLLFAAPIMGQAFWHPLFGIIPAIPRSAQIEYSDALSDRLWPHGPNLIRGALAESNRERLTLEGDVVWKEVAYNEGKQAVLPVLENTEPDAVSSIRIRVPLLQDGKPFLRLEEPYALTVLIRPRGLGASSMYYCRVYRDDEERFTQEVFGSRQLTEPTYLHKTGFVRMATYGVVFAGGVRDHVFVEFGLSGAGSLEIYDPKLMNVNALDSAFLGRKMVTKAQYEALDPEQRGGLIVKPDRLLSWEGLKYLFTGYIPLGDWLQTLFSWSALAVLILTATFAIAALMRRQWIDNERYPLPLTRIPLALLGDEDDEGRALPAIWRNRVMWFGLGAGLFWCLMRGWQMHNPNVPDMNISVQLNPYFSDPSWGKMWWNTSFGVSALVVSLAIFMELNVLISLVIGYFVYRSEFWMGYASGLDYYEKFPFAEQQLVSAYLVYAIMVLLFSRKYLWRILKEAFAGGDRSIQGEALSSRWALALLLASFIGTALWAMWAEVGVGPMLLFFLFLVLVGFVAAKLRAECGTPAGQYYPHWVVYFCFMAGSLPVFGASGLVIATIVTYLLCGAVFFLIPGMQVEFLELGRSFRVVPRHLVYTVALGIGGGLLIGGCVFLSSVYALGGDNLNIWIFSNRDWFFRPFITELNEATNRYFEQGSGAAPAGNPANWAYVFAACVTVLMCVLRQLFAGFWFHPMGFIVGPSEMMGSVWGSLLVAWAIRLTALKLGGAATVRTKLFPFFIGVFLSSLAAYVLFSCVNGYLYFFHPGADRPMMVF